MVSEQRNDGASRGGCAEILAMPGPASSAAVFYAVIEAIRTEGDRERFAIAYLNERALRTVIATACIIATGFVSREEALQACAAPLALAG
jgi:hypothetical protein